MTEKTQPTDAEILELASQYWECLDETESATEIELVRAALAKWGTPQQEAQEPCQTCAALARTVMLDQVSFDRKPDCYGIRQITDDEGVEEWEDIRISPDVAREEANDMMATGRGEIYEVVPLWTTPQPTQPLTGAVPLTREQVKAICVESGYETATLQERADFINGIRHAEQHHGIKGGQHG